MSSLNPFIDYLIRLMVQLMGVPDLYPIRNRTSQKTILPLSPFQGIDRLIPMRTPT